jgi:hypothetical protein
MIEKKKCPRCNTSVCNYPTDSEVVSWPRLGGARLVAVIVKVPIKRGGNERERRAITMRSMT